MRKMSCVDQASPQNDRAPTDWTEIGIPLVRVKCIYAVSVLIDCDIHIFETFQTFCFFQYTTSKIVFPNLTFPFCSFARRCGFSGGRFSCSESRFVTFVLEKNGIRDYNKHELYTFFKQGECDVETEIPGYPRRPVRRGRGGPPGQHGQNGLSPPHETRHPPSTASGAWCPWRSIFPTTWPVRRSAGTR